MFLIIVLLLGAILIFGFRTRTVQVEGNEYYGESSITAWIQNDDLSVNTLYILFKYNLTDADVPSGVESMSASLVNPWTVKITVKEKEMLGYVDYDGAYLYFDRNGIASLRTKEILEGVPYIEGLEFDASEVEMGSVLPVSDDSIFKKIMDVSNFLTNTVWIPTGWSVRGRALRSISAVWKSCLARKIMRTGSLRWSRSWRSCARIIRIRPVHCIWKIMIRILSL